MSMKHYHHERNHQGLDNLIQFPYASVNKGQGGSVINLNGLEGC